LSDILQDTFRNAQEIMRSEVRLARVEVQGEITKAKTSAMWLGMGAAIGYLAAFFLFLSAAAALALVLPVWAATLIVGGVLLLVALVLVSTGLKHWKKVRGKPTHTIHSMKENLEWAKQQTR
jgi:hypothetical protein